MLFLSSVKFPKEKWSMKRGEMKNCLYLRKALTTSVFFSFFLTLTLCVKRKATSFSSEKSHGQKMHIA